MNNLFVLHYFAAACDTTKTFFGLPVWYKYLKVDPKGDALGNCKLMLSDASGHFVLNNLWLIAFAVVELLLRVAALIAIGFVVYGGIQYIISQGEPDRLQQARHTIINALIGLVIAVSSVTIVAFAAGRFK